MDLKQNACVLHINYCWIFFFCGCCIFFLGFVPICALGLSQIGRMNLGMDASTFKYYTMCGLQEGFEPFAVNMNRDVAMWFSKRLPTFVNVPKSHPHIEVTLHVREAPVCQLFV